MSPTVTVSISYRHARAALDWLVTVFGFAEHAVYPGPGDTILHAELTLGTGMIMIGTLPPRGTFYGDLIRMPDEVGGYCTQSVNLVVADPDAACERAKAAGATIVSDIEDKPYGGRGFSCRDPEGHLWHVGSYDPWALRG
ncbi:VOC family protein [Nitrospirillum iridis]|uniref:Putative glyoxalase superfamily protein PhnB n=1 Tax=Nitrospirillum iridis TaxID=765888 RepID=A0A7X0B2J8_9PROT|nr:VOC family protein [Nitrospirillum iridis]MBB6254512.1 putative glyoxalase superfamily protein PhnB [Nitrospirillum iridis]